MHTVATPLKKEGRDCPHRPRCSCSTWTNVSWAPGTWGPRPTTTPDSLRSDAAPHAARPITCYAVQPARDRWTASHEISRQVPRADQLRLCRGNLRGPLP